MSTELVRCDYCGSVVSPEVENPRNRIAALEAEVAELRRDRDRLAWLEGKGTIEITCWASYTDTYSVGEQADDGERYNSLREALDAAMTAEENRPQ